MRQKAKAFSVKPANSEHAPTCVCKARGPCALTQVCKMQNKHWHPSLAISINKCSEAESGRSLKIHSVQTANK